MTWGYVTDWPAGTPRVLMTDCWLQNAGDAAIAIATKRMILRFAPSAAILHAAYGADSVGERYPELAIVPPLDSLLGTRWAEPDRETGVDGPALVSGADFVFSQGGGFLREGYQPWSRIDALLRATDLVGSVSLLGQTIGVFTTAFGRVALGELLRRSSAVLVRDTNSRASASTLVQPRRESTSGLISRAKSNARTKRFVGPDRQRGHRGRPQRPRRSGRVRGSL
jgi:hypothetical protein